MATAPITNSAPTTNSANTANNGQRFISAGQVSVSKLIEGVGYQLNVDPKQISKVEIFDVDIVLFMQDGRRVIVAGGAMEAQNSKPPAVLTSAGLITLESLVNQVGQIKTEKFAAPIFASAVVVNAAEQDIKKEPFSDSPASADKADRTKGSENASPSAGTVNTETIDTFSQAAQKSSQTSKALQIAAQNQIAEQSQRSSNEQIAQPASPASLTGVPQVIKGDINGVKVQISSFNVGGSTQTDSASGRVINGGIGSAQSSADASGNVQLQKLVIDASSNTNAVTINGMGQFSDLTNASGLSFQRKVTFDLVGAQKVTTLTLSGLPSGVKIASDQATFDPATEVWTIDLSKIRTSNSATVSSIDLTFLYDPKSTDLNGTATLHSEGIFLGTPFTNDESFSLVGKDVATANDFNSTGAQTTVVLPTNTPGTILTGGSGNDTITGTLGNDLIDGGAGTNTLRSGGGGQDTFVVNNLDDSVTGSSGTGDPADLVIVKSDGNLATPIALNANAVNVFSLADSAVTGVNNLTLDNSAAAAGLKGNNQANVLTGKEASGSELWGVRNSDGSADTLIGKSGNDTFIVNNGDVVQTSKAGQNWVVTDTTFTGSGYTLGANLDNLRLSGANNLNGTGNSAANQIIGNSGNNRLDGGANNSSTTSAGDTLVGGGGNDTYVLRGENDKIMHYDAANNLVDGAENDGISKTVYVEDPANMGIEALQIDLGNTKYANIHNLILNAASTQNIDLMGTAANNTLSGNKGDNRIDGNGGLDNLVGGGGKDTFLVYDTATKVNNAGGTTGVNGSQIWTNVDFSLAGKNVNYLKLHGATEARNITAAGVNASNILVGDDKNNVITSGNAGDTLYGGGGDDTFVVNNSRDKLGLDEGSISISSKSLVQSTVSFDLSQAAIGGRATTVSQLQLLEPTLAGANKNTTAIGNGAGGNIITGNSGKNVLYGGASVGESSAANTLIGGGGDDTYIMNQGDIIQAAAGGSSSEPGTVVALGASGALSDALSGVNTLVLVDGTSTVAGLSLTGSAKNGTGNGQANTISVVGTGARSGPHTLAGGNGDDTYIIQNVRDVIIENAGAAAGNDQVRLDVGANDANYTLAANVERLVNLGSGNATLIGNGQNSTITAGSGNSVISDGGASAAGVTMIGGVGNDTFMVSNAADVITSGGGNDVVYTKVSYTLAEPSGGNGVANIEARAFTGGAISTSESLAGGLNLGGNSLANNIRGTTFADRLTGGGGNDTFDGQGGVDSYIGGAGRDSYIVYDSATSITSGGGNDSVLSFVNFTTTDASLSYLKAAATTSTAPAAADSAINLANTGTGASTLVGNTAANQLTGGSGNDLLSDADIVYNDSATWVEAKFSKGADSLIGGSGNDTYVLSNRNDLVTDSGGNNSVYTLVDFDSNDSAKVSLSGGATIQTLTLIGQIGASGRTLVGSSAGGANLLDSTYGGSNTLSDGGGANTLDGGNGNDTYMVSHTGTTITDSAGTDTVSLSGTTVTNAAVTYTLGATLENLTATQTTAVNLAGNTQDNLITISATSAANASTRVDGGAGADTLAVSGSFANFNINSLISGSGASGVSKLSNIETLSFADNTSETITVSGADIRKLIGSPSTALTLKLDAGDTLTVSDAAADFVRTDNTYVFYNPGSAHVDANKLATLNVSTA